MTAKKVKSIVKTNVADKATFGTNPKDPWSTKAELGESAGLDKYLLSRGINTKFVSKDTKVAHSKSNQFKQWARDHAMREDTVTPSPTMDRLRQIKKKEREGKVIHHQESTLGPRADKLLARSDSAFKAGDKETSSRAHKLFMRAKEKQLSNPDNAEKHRAHVMGGAGDYYKSKKPGQYVGDSVELEGNIVSETNVCTECNEDPCACSHGFVEGNLAEGLPQTLRKVVPGYAKREIDKKMDAGKFGKTDADKDANFQRYKKIQDKIKEQGVAEGSEQDKDMTGQTCQKCKKGKYQERSQHDDMDGKVTCSCGNRVDRWKKYKEQGVAEGSDSYTVANDPDKPGMHSYREVGHAVQSGHSDAAKIYKNNKFLGTVGDVRKQGVSEAKEADYGGDYQSAVHAVKTKAEKKPVDMKSLAARMQASYRRDNEKSKVKAIPAMKENMMDPSAPSQAPVDGANSSNDCEPQPTKQPQISKAAKLIKSLKKTKVVKEELYDHEKEDKSVKSNKKTTFQKPGEDSVTKEQPQAAAVLSGGKTMTGTPRDVVEIDPMMKMRKQVPDGQKQNEKPQKNG